MPDVTGLQLAKYLVFQLQHHGHRHLHQRNQQYSTITDILRVYTTLVLRSSAIFLTSSSIHFYRLDRFDNYHW